VGVQFVALPSLVWPDIPNVVVPEEIARREDERGIVPQGIRVMYAGAEPARGHATSYLRFVVHNGTAGQVSYGAKGAEFAFPEVRVNGRKLPDVYRCGSGASLYFIEPGRSAELRVGVYEFKKTPRKGDLITVAFYLRRFGASASKEIVSEPFLLPDSFRRSIDHWNSQVPGE
jgi:hypothetical protein